MKGFFHAAALAFLFGTSASAGDAAAIRVHSLDGVWKFKGFDRQATRFAGTTDEERNLLAPGLDDSGWYDIKVPLNWWRDSAHHLDRCQCEGEIYYRGYYRRMFEVRNARDGRRRVLRFSGVGRECELYVNGRFVRHHLGEFTPFEADVTDLLVDGRNLVALRVLADFGPVCGEPWRHGYGATWGNWIMKGGLWQSVVLLETPSDRFRHVLIDTLPSLNAVCVCWDLASYGGSGPAEIVARVRDTAGRTVSDEAVLPVTLKGKTDRGRIEVSAKGITPWTPDTPVLYSLEIGLRREGRIVSSHTERFGFRRMEVRGRGFYLNGSPIYLVGDTAQSGGWGGVGADERAHALKVLGKHKANGVNVLRTAHMPTIREVYDVADELGILIYDEWSTAFAEKLDEPVFERNNLAGLREFILANYNHPSVTMYSLGNEVVHKKDPAMPRQLDKQYDLVKKLDTQGRPVCSFSGVAVIGAYGNARLKTDFLDLHNYIGIEDVSWTRWFPVMDNKFMKLIDSVFGVNGRLEMPLVMFECVGAGWGVHQERDVKPGDPQRYVDYVRNPCGAFDGSHNTSPCFSHATGLYRLVDPETGGHHFIQGYLGRRLCEMYLQDDRLAGFAPWFGDSDVPGIRRWMQKVYPLLRFGKAGDRAFMPAQLVSPGEVTLECVVLNKRAKPVRGAKVRVSFESPDCQTLALGECVAGDVGPMGERAVPFVLRLPTGLPAKGKMKLVLDAVGGETAWNDYDVTVHSAKEMTVSVGAKAPPAAVSPLPSGGAVRLAHGDWKGKDRELRDFVRRGGTLLVTEPGPGSVPGFPEIFVKTWGNHLADLVVPSHPAFEGLVPEDFDLWAENPYGEVATNLVCNLDCGLLAGIWRGAMLVEYGFGAGRIVVSTFAAEGAARTNPAAARHLANLYRYVNGGASGRVVPVVLSEHPSDREPKSLTDDAYTVPGCPYTLDFAGFGTGNAKPPVKIFSFMPQRAKVSEKDYTCLEIRYRAHARGLLDITLPKSDHSTCRIYTLPVADDGGEERTACLDLESDFRFADPAKPFPMTDCRGEVLIYNGYCRKPFYPRPPVKVDILSMKFRK